MKHTALLAFAVMLLLTACGGDKQEQQQGMDKQEMQQDVASAYYCPMKCEGEKTYPELGSCPVCGMDLVAVEGAEQEGMEGHEGHDHGEESHEGHNH